MANPVLFVILLYTVSCAKDPMVNVFAVNTWPFTNATLAAYNLLLDTGSAVDAAVAGCTKCEMDQCDGTVGWGGSPDEDGHTTLDALIMEGSRQDTGAVIQLKGIREASQVARAVLQHTEHTILVGENATSFAEALGFSKKPMESQRSIDMWKAWKNNKCQPNYWKSMVDSKTKCKPYVPEPVDNRTSLARHFQIDRFSHDTIGIITLDWKGKMAVGTSTNGLRFKIPGRSSDSALPGCGGYVDNTVGGAVATGDGDIMMRFNPAFLAVELMRNGISPGVAAKEAVGRIAKKYPKFSGAVVTASKEGVYGAGCYNIPVFKYSVADLSSPGVRLVTVNCTSASIASFVIVYSVYYKLYASIYVLY